MKAQDLPAESSYTSIDKSDMPAARDKPKLEEAVYVHYEEDVYDVTIAACFGGLRFDLSDDMYLILHPVFPFIGCVALFIVQLILIAGVALEVKEAEFMDQVKENQDRLGNRFDMALATDTTLMVVLQCVIFAELQQGLKMLCFSLSPRTWGWYSAPPNPDRILGKEAFNWRTTLAPLAALVSIFKILVAYLVSSTSISIILSCGGVTDAIFNSLALTFIMDLDEQVWKLLNSASDLRLCDPTNGPNGQDQFVFKLKEHKKVHGFFNEKNWRRMAVAGAVTYVWLDQMALTLSGMWTGWLPSTRLICGTWRFSSGLHQSTNTLEDSAGWGAKELYKTLEHCDDQNFSASATDKYSIAMKHHPRFFWGATLLGLTFITSPPIVNYLFMEFAKKKQRDKAESEAESEYESESSRSE